MSPERVEAYLGVLKQVGLMPVASRPAQPVDFATVDGLVLCGGTDVNPALYGEKPGPRTEAPDHARDAMERGMVDAALARGLPILGICRGLQLLNVSLGGTLDQHIEEHSADYEGPAEHDVHLVSGTRLAAIYGKTTHRVNSRHHQAALQTGQGLVVAARDDDGVIEAVEHTGVRFVVGVQWHPENRFEQDHALFAAFAAEVRLS